MWLFGKNCSSKESLEGKTAIVTGANGGIGKEVVRDFYQRGARVILACRNLELGQETKDAIVDNNGDHQTRRGELVLVQLDLSSLKSVKECAENILKSEPKINLLINNAGVFAPAEIVTQDGFETNFGVNYLGNFLFTLLLLPRLIESKPARIVNVSSISFTTISSIDYEDLNFQKPTNPYVDLLAYGQSKLFLIFFTRELAKRLTKKGILDVTVYSLHPGHAATNITRNYGGYGADLYRKIASMFLKTPTQGAQTIIHCAVDEKTRNESGFFYRNCAVADLTKFARNEDNDLIFWNRSIDILNKFFGDQSFVPKVIET